MDMNQTATATIVENSMNKDAQYPTTEEIWGMIEQKPRHRVDKAKISTPPGVTPEDVTAAAFDSVSDKRLFTGAFSGLTSNDASVRALAANAIGYIRHELSVRTLIAQLGRETSEEARAACINGLRRQKSKEGLPAVVNALGDEHAIVRLAAVRAVYRLAGRESVAFLVRMLHDEDQIVRRRAATCLGWLEHKPAEDDLIPLLDESSAFVRCAILGALANLRSSRAVPRIIELLNDPVESVRKKAYRALKTITRACADSPEIMELARQAS